jgi:hypothetical protein
MFHSCLAHQPIFPRREELARIRHWWTLSPGALEPWSIRQQVTEARAAHYDVRRDPFLIYTIRMEAILKAWEPIWNHLGGDPQYRDAARMLFSDHGERFYHVTPEIRLGGIHGYDLDPWETRIMLKIAGPGFSAQAGGPAETATVSVLSLRDAIAGTLATGKPITNDFIKNAYPVAPMRYHSIDRSMFTPEPAEYRQMAVDTLVKGTGIAPNGIWFTRYEKPAAERAEEVSIGWGRGDKLEVIRPLKAGGAHRYLYDGFNLTAVSTVTEEVYLAEKARIKAALTAHPPEAGR